MFNSNFRSKVITQNQGHGLKRYSWTYSWTIEGRRWWRHFQTHHLWCLWAGSGEGINWYASWVVQFVPSTVFSIANKHCGYMNIAPCLISLDERETESKRERCESLLTLLLTDRYSKPGQQGWLSATGLGRHRAAMTNATQSLPWLAQNSSFFHIFSEPCLVDLTGVSGTFSVPNISLIYNQGCLLCYKKITSAHYLHN